MYSKLVKRIQQLLEQQEVVTVAISGHGGSGKSTLAAKLARQFGIGDDQVIQTDGLYAKNYMHAKSIYEQHDWDTLTDLLKNVHSTDRMKYRSRDWKEVESQIDVPRPKVLIVEGIRLIRPELLAYFDVSVWIDCPLELATERAIRRNKLQGDSEEDVNLWHTKWVPESKEYVEDAQPSKIADVVYSEYDSEL